jgi:hypothetical protein
MFFRSNITFFYVLYPIVTYILTLLVFNDLFNDDVITSGYLASDDRMI